MENKNKLFKILGNLDLVVSGLALIILIILTFAGVIMRYVFGNPFTWLVEVQLACMVWIVYAGAGAAYRTGNHVAIEMVVDMFPSKIQKIMEVVISIVVVLVVGFLFVQSLGFVELFINNGRTTNMLSIPYKLIYGIVPISCISMVINYIYSKYQEIKDSNVIKGAK